MSVEFILITHLVQGEDGSGRCMGGRPVRVVFQNATM
jgi:hypothetical protein